METVREKVAGLLPPIIEHKVTGEANVQQMFEIDLKGRKTLKVAGCRVVNGTLEKNKSIRLLRNGEIIHDGKPPLSFFQYESDIDGPRHIRNLQTPQKRYYRSQEGDGVWTIILQLCWRLFAWGCDPDV
jgi:hypothetical protein